MCGIAGQYVPIGQMAQFGRVERITKLQERRGPDHIEVSHAAGPRQTIVMGHNRLSIIDLSEAANQPMSDGDDRLRIVFNGEIYNYIELRSELTSLGHRFRTASDTEVILESFKRWGSEAFSRFNGMFAFALFDRTDGRLWLVRDRFGVKPLYYTLIDRTVFFASTPGPLAQELSCEPNLEYAARGISYWIYEDETDLAPFTGIHAVPAGSFVVASVSDSDTPTVEVSRWYDFRTRVAGLREDLAAASDDALVGQFAALLHSAVSVRLRADVPLGISLSGGLDSSSIASIASTGADLRAFSYGDPGDSKTEGPLTAAVAERLGIEVHYARLSPEERIAAFWETLAAQGAPFPDPSVVAQYSVFRLAHQSGLKVLLGGQGADEALMGYRKFQVLLLREAVQKRDPVGALNLAVGLAFMLGSEAARARTYLRQIRRYTSADGLQTSLAIRAHVPKNPLGAGSNPAWLRQADDMVSISLPTLLRYEDRNSMANSLETRLPFLDYRVAEFAVALPNRLKVRRGFGKWVLRQAMADRVPSEVRAARYKRGFDVGRSDWIRSGLGQAIRERLMEMGAQASEWLPAGGAVDRLFSDARLSQHPSAFAEATTLLWLIDSSSWTSTVSG